MPDRWGKMGNRRKKAPKEHLAEPDPAPELQRHEAPAPEGLRADLAKLKLSALKKRARVAGIDQDTLDEADDVGDVKTVVIDLIVAAEAKGAEEAARLAAEEEAAKQAQAEAERVAELARIEAERARVQEEEAEAKAAVAEAEAELHAAEEEVTPARAEMVNRADRMTGKDIDGDGDIGLTDKDQHIATAQDHLAEAETKAAALAEEELAAEEDGDGEEDFGPEPEPEPILTRPSSFSKPSEPEPEPEPEPILRSHQSYAAGSAEGSDGSQEASADELEREARQRALIAHIEETDRNSHVIRRADDASGGITTVADNFYEILDVTHDADKATIKKAYLKGALLIHPDKCQLQGAEEAFKKISEAWTCLSDEEKRKKYDFDLRFGMQSSSAPRASGMQSSSSGSGSGFGFCEASAEEYPQVRNFIIGDMRGGWRVKAGDDIIIKFGRDRVVPVDNVRQGEIDGMVPIPINLQSKSDRNITPEVIEIIRDGVSIIRRGHVGGVATSTLRSRWGKGGGIKKRRGTHRKMKTKRTRHKKSKRTRYKITRRKITRHKRTRRKKIKRK